MAVAVGVERTGRIVTAAALLFAVAFGAFVTSEIVILKVLGLGAALAVLIDATVTAPCSCPRCCTCSDAGAGGPPRPSAGCTPATPRFTGPARPPRHTSSPGRLHRLRPWARDRALGRAQQRPCGGGRRRL
jgi:hypothetical protein